MTPLTHSPCVPLSRVPWPDGAPLIHPSWCSADVTALAAAIRADGSFDRLPVLADALEDAGCTDPSVLGHCRACDRHIPDCWVIAAVLMEADLLARTDPPRSIALADAPRPRLERFLELVRAVEDREQPLLAGTAAGWLVLVGFLAVPLVCGVVVVCLTVARK